jgi:hypothetical protein
MHSSRERDVNILRPVQLWHVFSLALIFHLIGSLLAPTSLAGEAGTFLLHHRSPLLPQTEKTLHPYSRQFSACPPGLNMLRLCKQSLGWRIAVKSRGATGRLLWPWWSAHLFIKALEEVWKPCNKYSRIVFIGCSLLLIGYHSPIGLLLVVSHLFCSPSFMGGLQKKVTNENMDVRNIYAWSHTHHC